MREDERLISGTSTIPTFKGRLIAVGVLAYALRNLKVRVRKKHGQDVRFSVMNKQKDFWVYKIIPIQNSP